MGAAPIDTSVAMSLWTRNGTTTLFPFLLTSLICWEENSTKLPLAERRVSFGTCEMYQPPPLRGRSVFDGKKVLLIDPHQRARDVRASVLRSRGIEVDATDSLQAARSLGRPKLYDLIMLDARGYIPGEAFDFYLEVKHANPLVRVVFLVGPPTFLSLTWPTEVMAREKEPQRWAETVRRFVTAA
jgi:hypothetical protein